MTEDRNYYRRNSYNDITRYAIGVPMPRGQTMSTTVNGVRQPHSSSARAAPMASNMMRNVFESMMSPFVKCWHPPLDACGGFQESVPTCGSGNVPPSPIPTVSLKTSSTTSTIVTPTAESSPPQALQQALPRTSHPVLAGIENPTEKDVLCGRGGGSTKHNRCFRELIAANKASYSTLTKKQKMLVSKQVVETIHSAGGLFLAKDPVTGLWNDIGMPRSLEKASQALREKGTNYTPNNRMVGVDEEVVKVVTNCQIAQAKTPKLSPRIVEAPTLVIPPHLRDVYHPQTPFSEACPSPYDNNSPGWLAEFSSDATFSQPYQFQSPQAYHPSDRLQTSPAPYMGVFPFSNRHMRVDPPARRIQNCHSDSAGLSPPMVSPVAHSLSWQQKASPAASNQHSRPNTCGKSNYPIQQTPSWFDSCSDYQSDTASIQSFSSSVTHSAPESHQFNPDFRSPARTPLNTWSAMTYPHQCPLKKSAPDDKRKRTRKEEEMAMHLDDEVNVGVFDDDENNENAFLVNDTSLTEGSRQLPFEVESKLTLQEKVISPSGMLQSRSRTSRHQFSPLIPKTASTTIATPIAGSSDNRLNTSAEAESLAGLAALSTAAFLRLDEG
jgi:hypothetical protein